MDYKSAGVNVEAGRDFVDRIKGSVEATARPEVIGGVGGFGGLMRLPQGFEKPVLVSGADGVGTKLELAQANDSHHGVGIDLVAMCVNDVITTGAEPLFFLDYIATGKLAPEALAEVIEGISEGCQESKCSLLGGETAEMPGFYNDHKYDLAGFCVAIVDEDKIINGTGMKVGDRIIGIESNGLHSNGFSLVRKIVAESIFDQNISFGPDKEPLIKYLLRPTRIYASLVQTLLKQNVPIKGMAHITGGGLPENLPRCIPSRLRASINNNSWEVPPIYSWLSKQGDVPMKDLWNTFNLGIGFCLIVPSNESQRLIDICASIGMSSWVIGQIEENTTNSSTRISGLPN